MINVLIDFNKGKRKLQKLYKEIPGSQKIIFVYALPGIL